MKYFELAIFALCAVLGLAGMLAVSVFGWEPGAKITSTAAFAALMFASNARYWIACYDPFSTKY